MNIEDMLFLGLVVAFFVMLFSIVIYKLMTVGKVQIMKVDGSYAVRQYAGINSFDYIHFEDLFDYKWKAMGLQNSCCEINHHLGTLRKYSGTG